MRTRTLFNPRPKFAASYIAIILLLLLPTNAKPDFWSIKGKGELETVKLTRRLPPIAQRSGDTVRFEPEISGASIPPEVATVLRERIRTLLLNAKTGAIQLVDGPADTVIKCILTGYEPKVLHPDERQVGNNHQKIITWIGNIEASVQVLDKRNHPIDSASGNLKFHLEDDYVVAETEDKVTSVTDKKASRWDKLAQGLKTARGGDAGDVVKTVGGSQSMHDQLSKDEKHSRQPTDLEWRNLLIQGLADKVANRIVAVDEEFTAILPVDKEFSQMCVLAKAGRWGDVHEQGDKMEPQKDSKEAYRLYMMGLSDEANAYGDGVKTGEAADLLNKASKEYSDAQKLQPKERELFLASVRAQDSLDHYLEIQHEMQTRKTTGMGKSGSDGDTKGKESKEDVADNAALIGMAGANLPESVMVEFVQTAAEPKFDASAKGLIQLGQAKVPAAVIKAVQKKMAAKPGSPNGTPVKRSTPVATHQ